MDDVAANVSIVLAGLDSKTGQFTEPPDQIKKDIDEIKQSIHADSSECRHIQKRKPHRRPESSVWLALDEIQPCLGFSP